MIQSKLHIIFITSRFLTSRTWTWMCAWPITITWRAFYGQKHIWKTTIIDNANIFLWPRWTNVYAICLRFDCWTPAGSLSASLYLSLFIYDTYRDNVIVLYILFIFNLNQTKVETAYGAIWKRITVSLEICASSDNLNLPISKNIDSGFFFIKNLIDKWHNNMLEIYVWWRRLNISFYAYTECTRV